jgi:hypothetical protein
MTARPRTYPVTVRVTAACRAALAALCDAGDPAEALAELALRAEDGVTRPGAWERDWLCQAFGFAWQDRLVGDPDVEWMERPRRRRAAREAG